MKFTKMHGLGNDYLYVYGAVIIFMFTAPCRKTSPTFPSGCPSGISARVPTG